MQRAYVYLRLGRSGLHNGIDVRARGRSFGKAIDIAEPLLVGQRLSKTSLQQCRDGHFVSTRSIRLTG